MNSSGTPSPSGEHTVDRDRLYAEYLQRVEWGQVPNLSDLRNPDTGSANQETISPMQNSTQESPSSEFDYQHLLQSPVNFNDIEYDFQTPDNLSPINSEETGSIGVSRPPYSKFKKPLNSYKKFPMMKSSQPEIT